MYMYISRAIVQVQSYRTKLSGSIKLISDSDVTRGYMRSSCIIADRTSLFTGHLSWRFHRWKTHTPSNSIVTLRRVHLSITHHRSITSCNLSSPVNANGTRYVSTKLNWTVPYPIFTPHCLPFRLQFQLSTYYQPVVVVYRTKSRETRIITRQL